ncbi:ORF6N domain-containing protein [uncultured Treponema sp.]|uniref:ORF6N domain-containing protein n=1 Tax=uncultured Treponema sp. TaxID=162155 RepID=UPI0025E67A2F|nr:ORF6N domain-containing protein [uncultured Treponema sp.]
MKNEDITPILVESKIFLIRGKQVMIDRDLAELYGVETKRITEAVKRNIERFPEEFRFQLTSEEYDFLRSQFATSKPDEVLRSQSVTSKMENDSLKSQSVTLNSENDSLRSQISTLNDENDSLRGKHSKYLPYVFTVQGVAMLSAVLRSETAVQVSIRIMNAFVQLRHYVSSQIVKTDDKAELAEIRRLLLLHIDHCDKKFFEQDRKISQIIQVLNNLIEEPKSERKIGFTND